MSDAGRTELDISGIDFDDINLLDSTVFAERVPHEWFAFLRQNETVRRMCPPRRALRRAS